jgi:RecA/RadA recombinase
MAENKLDPILAELLAKAKNRLGKGLDGRTYLAKEMEKNQVGIPLPGLSAMYLLDNTVLALGKIYGLAGYSQSQKSSLGFEMMRWMCRHGSGLSLVEAEGGKYSPTLVRSILEEHTDNLIVDQAVSLEVVQKTITDTVKVLRKNRNTLWAIMLDSLAGTETDGGTDKIESEGFAQGRAYPESALSNTKYFKWLSGAVSQLPAIFLFVNHLKDQPSPMPGMPAMKTTPGGKAQRFHTSTYLWVKRNAQATTKQKRTVDGRKVVMPQEIRPLELKCDKNSLGTEGRKIEVDFWWYRDNLNHQHSFFDWEASTADLLVTEQETRGVIDVGQSGHYEKLRNVCDVSVTEGLYSSSRLKLKSVEGHEVGAAVHANNELMNQLVDFFGIKRSQEWDGKSLPGDAAADVPEEPPDEDKPEKARRR